MPKTPLCKRYLLLFTAATLLISQGTALPALAEDEEEEAGPTPLSEFAPDEIQPTRAKKYDQGLTIDKVSIEGNQLINSEQIRSSMLTRPGTLFNKKTLQTDLHRIYDLGYFTENIKAVPISTSEGIHLRIEVEENAPVTGVNIDGNTIMTDEELQEIFAGQTGLPQNIGQLNESIQKIEEIYADKGYILTRVTSISDDPDGMINLEVNEGTINKVNFIGNRKTKDNVIKRMMTTKAGQVYNEKNLTADLKRIFSLQSFSDVRRVITASPDDPNKYDLTVELDEKKTGAISLGGGMDTATGFFGSVGYNDPNFLGRGQNLSSVFSVGTGIIGRGDTIADARTYQFELNWSNPSVKDTDNALATSLYGRDLSSFNVPLAIERRIGGEISWARPIKQLKNTSMSLALGAERVSLREGATSSDLAAFGITNSQRSSQLDGGTFISVTPTIAYDSRDNRFDPSSGWLNTLSVGGNYGLGGTSYATLTANVRKYIKLRDNMTLALNAQGGASPIGNMPEFNMFRMGGAYTVRGFREGGLGAGSGFLLGTAELRTKMTFLEKINKFKHMGFLNSLQIATFVDAGSVFDEASTNSNFGFNGTGASIGAGFRLNIPGLGPIRIDYAVPIMGGGDTTQRINFGVGQKF